MRDDDADHLSNHFGDDHGNKFSDNNCYILTEYVPYLNNANHVVDVDAVDIADDNGHNLVDHDADHNANNDWDLWAA